MVQLKKGVEKSPRKVSVLALSSRFDGLLILLKIDIRSLVSVLALSSRFDGPIFVSTPAARHRLFQYSLCRVVLMVLMPGLSLLGGAMFQYSLCRVVLMVTSVSALPWRGFPFQYSLCRVVLMVFLISGARLISGQVSVLALSSRFDGPSTCPRRPCP